MTDEVDVMKRAIWEYDKASKIQRLNEQLLDHLLGSVHWLLKHCEKYNISLPEKDTLYRIMEEGQVFVQRIGEENSRHIPNSED